MLLLNSRQVIMTRSIVARSRVYIQEQLNGAGMLVDMDEYGLCESAINWLNSRVDGIIPLRDLSAKALKQKTVVL
jgi:hypothetical protein